MNMTDNESAEAEWRAGAARCMRLWRNGVGGTVKTLQKALEDDGFPIHEHSLAQNMRPNGRKPRHASDLLRRASKIIAQKLLHRRPDLNLKQFEEELARHIQVGTPSPIEQPHSPTLIAHTNEGHIPRPASFDLWTPGLSDRAILERFSPDLGSEGADKVRDLSRAAINAIGRGDFLRQKKIAEEAVELGRAATDTSMEGEGLYLLAEATRLLADLQADQDEAKQLRKEAEQLYGQAGDKLGGDPRAVRGLARTIEVLGDLPRALRGFTQAQLTTELDDITDRSRNPLSAAHERVRSLRHKITCLAAIHSETPTSTLLARRRAEEIRRLLQQSEAYHRETLGRFRDYDQWWRIEWFMAQVLHAKGWIAISENGAAIKRLEWALVQRLQMIRPDPGPLSSVELSNLHWWANTVSAAASSLEHDQSQAFHELKAAIDRGEDGQKISRLGQSFLLSGAAPWADDF